MRPAPAVAVRCNGGPWWRALQAAVQGLATAVFAAFVLLHLERMAWPAVLAGLAVVAVAWRWADTSPHELRWDGQVWTIDGTGGSLAVMIDIGPVLLLRLRPAGGGRARWVAVTRREAGSARHPLRAALYSRPPETTAPRVRPPERTAAD